MSDDFVTEPSLQRPLEYLRSVLIPAETLEAWAVQHRLFAALAPARAGCRNQWPPDHDHPALDQRFRCF